jgi:Asp-tRNA(Asn)/Glu-tRNA(Gln) amidotransferase B subunit
MGFFMGQVMRALAKKIDANLIQKHLIRALETK